MPHHFSEEEQLHFVTTTAVFTNMMEKKGGEKMFKLHGSSSF